MSGPRTHAVVFHHPGPAWRGGVEFREQPGVQEHVDHYRRLLDDGHLELGGPFLGEEALGGMMVATPDMSLEDLDAFAAADPAVRSGLLTYEVRAWYVPFRGA